MNIKETLTEIFVIILASIVLSISTSFRDTTIMYTAALSFLIIISVNILVKKIAGFFLEIRVRTKFWSWHQFGFRKDMHFKKPVPMVWLPLLLSLFTKGFFWWLAILEFDVEAKTERVAKRHGLYRFTQVTEWHIAWIVVWGIIANLVLAVIAYITGFETFAKLSLYFAAWSTIPLSNLDGSKIFFGSRGLWMTVFVITIGMLIWGIAL